MYEAARVLDPISHSHALTGFLVGAAIGAALVAYTAFAFVTCGIGVGLLVGLLTYAGTTASLGLGEAIGRMFRTTTGTLVTGSPNVFTNDRAAAYVAESKVACSRDGAEPAPVVADGSATVFINNLPAARKDDAITCGALIEEGSPNVFIGGGTARYLEVADEISARFRKGADGLLLVAGLVGGLSGLAGRVGMASLRAFAPCALKYAAGYLAGEAVGRYVVGPAVTRGWGALTGNPVELTTGRKLLVEAPDLVLPDRMPLVLERFYASDLEHEGLFGRGWATAWEMRLEARGNFLVHTDAQGREIEFPPVPPGHILYAPAEQLHLGCTPDGRHFVRDLHQTCHVFEPLPDRGAAGLAHVEDLFGNWIRCERDAEGRLLALASSSGQRIALRYARSMNRVAAIERTHATGGEPAPAVLARYRYHANGQLGLVLDREERQVRAFDYQDGLMVEHRDALGFVSSYQWAEVGGTPRVVAHHTSTGERYRFRYDPAGRQAWAEDGFGHSAHWHYDARRNVIAFTDFDGGRYRTDYTDADLPAVLYLPGERKVRFEWDALARLAAETDPLGRTTRYRYDGDSLRRTRVELPDQSVWQARFDALGQLTGTTDPLGRMERYDYYEPGLPRAHTDAAGNARQLEWNARGQLTALTDCSGHTTRYDWDGEGRLAAVIDAAEQVTRYTWRPAGQLVAVHHPDGHVERFEWDAAGNLVAHIDGPAVAPKAPPLTRWERDTAGRLVRYVDPAGRHLDFAYDPLGRLLSLTNGNGAAYRFAYDAAGRLLRQVGVDGLETRHRYDAAGHLVETLTLGRERGNERGSEHTKTHHFRRDAMGRLLEARSATALHEYAYDAADRLTEARRTPTELGSALGVGPDALRFDYDAAGQLLAEHGAHGTVRYERDALGLPRRLALPQGQHLETLTYGSGHTHQIRFDGQVVSDFERDALHREVLRTQGRLATTFGYDSRGRLAWQRAQRGVLHSGPPPHLGPQGPAWGTPPAELWRRYTYNPVGELTEQTDPLRGAIRMRYDASGRLIGRAGEGLEERFAWDAAANLLEAATPAIRSAGRLEDNRLRVWQDLRFDYDPFGRLAAKRKGGWREQRFQYDADDRLLAIHESAHGALRTVRFDYDALGRRIAKHERTDARPPATTRFVWEGLRLVQELADSRVRSYLYAPEGAATAAAAPYTPLARIDQRLDAEGTLLAEPPRVHYFHTDALGTPLELTNPDGELEWVGRYDAWGKTDARHPLTGHATTHQPLRYPGQYEDQESGLHYNTFRYYDPDTGRFITQDPIGIAGGANLYGYAPNTTGWVDPWGWCSTVASSISGVPGRVQSRLNLQTGTNKFGMRHITREHLSGKANKSQFNMSESELRRLLQSRQVIDSPIVATVQSKTQGTLYVRQVDVGKTIGTDYLKNGNTTSIITVQSDKYGNIVTAFPGT